MKKSAISLSLLLLMGATALTSCNSSEIKPLKDKDGKDVLFSIGDDKFTVDDLLGSKGDFTYSFLQSEEGAKELYRAIEKAIVEKNVEMNDNIKNAVEIKMDDWAKKVESFAAENGLTERLAEQSLLTQEGFETRKDLEAHYVFLEKKQQFINEYKDDEFQPKINKDTNLIDDDDHSVLKAYVENTNPMIMKHILVKTADTAGAFNQANITEQEANKLGTVVMRLALGKKANDINSFANIAIDESEDGSAKNGGNLGIVDEYTSFVNEFKFGVYSSLAYNAKGTPKFDEVVSKLNLQPEMFGEGGIYETMGTIEVKDAVTALIKNGSKEHKPGEGEDIDYRLHDRNIEFNKEFNFSGAKYLVVSDKEALVTALADQGITATVNDIKTNDKNFVVDENDNPIVVTRSEFGIHFISVTWSSLDHTLNEAVGYFTTKSDYKDFKNGYYQNPMFNKGGSESQSTLEKNRKKEIEGRVTNYMQGGYAASVTADEQLMTYKIIKENLDTVNIPDAKVKEVISNDKNTGYLDLKINSSNQKIKNEIEKTVETYVNKVEASIDAHSIIDPWLEKGGK